MLANIFSKAIADDSGAGGEALKNSTKEVVQCILKALKDEEMKKPKRIREVLKATEKIVTFVEKVGAGSITDTKDIDQVLSELKAVNETTDVKNIKNLCESICPKMAEISLKIGLEAEEAMKTSSTGTIATPSTSAKKKKKKKKGKK